MLREVDVSKSITANTGGRTSRAPPAPLRQGSAVVTEVEEWPAVEMSSSSSSSGSGSGGGGGGEDSGGSSGGGSGGSGGAVGHSISLTFENVVGDAKTLHQSPSNAGAVFQVSLHAAQ
jgi:hypothetical protein